ncbi:MAG: Zn-ribbon domain-containing OB-fold protein [Myxococcota bacterium]|nr:Zn-ribbon domain-containing OB-fold protein [Myxococcota bacterium]
MSPKEIEYRTPSTNWQTLAFWEGCGRGELVLQRCQDCGIVQHRPRGLCASCLSSSLDHFVASGRAKVHTFTITHQNGMPAFRDACPYVLAYVDLEEGPRLMTHIVGCAPESVFIDMAVRADFVITDKDLGIPRFVPA